MASHVKLDYIYIWLVETVPFSKAILFSSGGDMAPDMGVNYFYVWVGYLACALDSPIRFGLACIRIEIRYVV